MSTHRNPSKTSIPQGNNPLANLSGGFKHKWLKEHRDTILDCLSIFGESWVIEQFHLTQDNQHDTLGQLIRDTPNEGRERAMHNKPVKVDYLEVRLEGLATEVYQNKREIENIKVLFQQFVESTSNQLAKSLIIPLLRSLLSFEGNLPEIKDPLVVEKLLTQAKDFIAKG